MKILLLQSDKKVSKDIRDVLEKENYSLDVFFDGQEALESLSNGYSCYILDAEAPSIDGLSLLELIRLTNKSIPIIITSSNDFLKIKKAYDLGCCDCLKKPFYLIELVNKVKKLCCIKCRFLEFDENFRFDFVNYILYKGNSEVQLTKKEILFLSLFCERLNKVATYEEITEYVWEGEQTNLTNIRAMIKRLRKKLPENSINIIKGLGYSLSTKVKLI